MKDQNLIHPDRVWAAGKAVLSAPISVALISCFFVCSAVSLPARTSDSATPWWPQEYRVIRNETERTLTLSTLYYQVVHDLARGGTISRIRYLNGQADNLLLEPFCMSVLLSDGKTEFSDAEAAPDEVDSSRAGKTVTVTTSCRLMGKKGERSQIQVKTAYEYHWGFIRIHRELVFPEATRIRRVNIFATRLTPSLTDYGYRPGIVEQGNSLPFGFNVIRWGKMRVGTHFDVPLSTSDVPEHVILLNPGVEGIEWFMSDDAWQWEYQMTGKPGTGLCTIAGNCIPAGIDLQLCPVNLPEGSVSLKGSYVFDCYIGMSIVPGHAQRPWFHVNVNRTKGNYVSADQIGRWSRSGVSTVLFQDDADRDDDGTFWKDGTYPPYPPGDMKKLDEAVSVCRENGMKAAFYFSIKELHPDAPAFAGNGKVWGRRYNDGGELKYSLSARGDVFGVEMCLKSDWLDCLKSNVDQVLRNHRIDGIYYDWNVPLYCTNSAHTARKGNPPSGNTAYGIMDMSPAGHRDVDELLKLLEWTRDRVGPDGLVIIHDTMVPMLATENFANYVVGMEWGYGMLSSGIPPVGELPPEWNLAGARPRGIIGYGTIHPDAVPGLSRRLAIETMLTGVTPWPAEQEAMDLYSMLAPMGNPEQYKFVDWRNAAVTIRGKECVSAVYSKSGIAYALLGNLGDSDVDAEVKIDPAGFPFPMKEMRSAIMLLPEGKVSLRVEELDRNGQSIALPAHGAVLIEVKGGN